jgi:hypothetical protein
MRKKFCINLKLKTMKKLTLNKKTIAQLDNPNSIYGGAPESYGAGTVPATCFNDPNHRLFNSGAQTACELTKKWHCPSENPNTFCYEYCDPPR